MKKSTLHRVTAAALACLTAVLGCTSNEQLRSSAALEPIDAESKEFGEAVIAAINAERLKADLPPLAIVPFLMNAADMRAAEIPQVDYDAGNQASHYRPDGRGASSILIDEDIGFSYFTENCAWGTFSPTYLVESWMNSVDHRNAILNQNFTIEYTHIGVGSYYDEELKITFHSMIMIGSYNSGEHYIYDDQYLPKLDRADVDSSLAINARDATLILEYSAAEAAGVKYPVIYSFEEAADVNADGSIDSIDASVILCYTAARGAGEDAVLDDFIW